MDKRQSRKFLLTINNPKDHDWNHEKIKQVAFSLKGFVYMCIADETGEKGTPHTHVFLCYQNPKLWSTIKNHFPEAHIDISLGSCQENRDYVFKQGKWANDPKADTSDPSTHEECGTMPSERLCPKPELALLYNLIESGMSDFDIIKEYPEYLFDITHIQRTRLLIKEKEFETTFRKLEVTYIWGKAGAGKSRYVMDKYGYENVFRVTDYIHPFDTYRGQDVLVFEEFKSRLQIQDMLNYLDGYPLKLPSRYTDKIACFTKVFLISNLLFSAQYPNVQDDEPEVFNAFKRRIHHYIYFYDIDKYRIGDNPDDIIENPNFVEIMENEAEQIALPFD